MSADGFTHLTSDGAVHMVDVSGKTPSVRQASAQARVSVAPDVLDRMLNGSVPKGDVWATARIAAILATKKCPELLPLAHTIGVHGVEVEFDTGADFIRIVVTVKTADRTGVEMEALTGASVGALAIIDMVKGLDRTARIDEIFILEKQGGRSGTWTRPDAH
ncbi:MAG: cyclic pyranopterin monophosphate synthase MoaC [Actinomycetota bacterium]